MQISELVEKIEGEIKAEREKVAEEASLLAKRKVELAEKEKAFKAKVSEFEKQKEALKPELDKIAEEKLRILTSDQVAEAKKEALIARSDAERFNSEAIKKLAEAKQKLDEQTKRELALSAREREYKAEIEKEVVKKFLSGTLMK